MANWQQQFKSWESQLKSSNSKNVKECVQEIRQTIAAVKKNDIQATLTCKVLNLACRVMNTQAGVELFTSLAQFIFDKYWDTFLYNLKYFMIALISKGNWSEAIKILPILDRCKTTENNLKDMLTIYSNCYVAFITYEQLPGSNFKLCTNKISKLLIEAHNKNTDLFLDLVNELLGTNRNFRILLWKHLDGTDLFIKSITGILQNCKNVNNINEFNESSCANCLFFINMDVRNKTAYSLLYVKAWMAAIKNTKDENAAGTITKLLTLVYFLIKIVSDSSLQQFDAYMIDVLQKLSRTLQTQSPTEPWCIFSAVIACNTIFRYCFEFSKKLKKECIDPMHDMLEVVFEIVQPTNSEAAWVRKYCLDCDDYVPHLKWSLCHLSAFNLRKSIQLEVKNDKFGNLFMKILENAMRTQTKFTCRELKGTVEHAMWECCNFITSSIQSKMFVNIAYRTLILWRKVEGLRDQLKSSQVVHFFKHLLKLNGRYREALEMQCLHIVHLINNPETKRLTVLDEMAVCCSSYKDAKMSFEASICDILDQANFDMDVPAYDRGLVKRLQLQASTTYAGIDPNFKVVLAKKLIMETYDEVELAHMVKAIGKLSFSELESKIQSSVESLKRKVLVDLNDHQKQLALGRLLTCHYKFVLERNKGMAGKKCFKENSFHEIGVEDLKKFDIYSENSMLEILITARDCFEQFFSKANLISLDFDWNDIVDDMSLLARHFALRGYLEQAYNSWLLIFKISDRYNLSLNKIRSVSFFAEYSNVIERIDKAVDLPLVINSVSESLISHYQELDKYSPRQQNYILLAILNIAGYYYRHKDLKYAHMLAELVRDARSKMKSRENSSELISIYLLAFNFNMISCLTEEEAANAASPYLYIHGILDAIANAKYVTSEDSINMPTFLFRLIIDVTSFTLSRLCAPPVRPLLFSILNWMEDFALGLRMAQIVLLLAAVDLQMERIDNFQAKATILGTLLAKQPQQLRKIPNEIPKSTFLTEDIIDMYDLAVEPARRVPLSPINIQRQPYIQSSKATRSEYLLEHPSHCTCHFCSNPPFQMISFELACLLAQNYYINGDYLSSESVLLQSLNWWKSNLKHPSLESIWFDSIFRMLVLYINTCRQMNMFDKTIKAIEEARTFLKKYEKDADQSYTAILAETELCIVELQRSHEGCGEVIQQKQTTSTELKTPKASKSRIKPLNIVTTSSSRKNMPANNPTKLNDLDIVTDLINDWNFSDHEGKENVPNITKKLKTAAKVSTTSRTIKAPRKKFVDASISPPQLPPNSPVTLPENGRDKSNKEMEIVEIEQVSSSKSKSCNNRVECKLKSEASSTIATQRRGRKKVTEQTDSAANVRKITTRRKQC